MRVHPSSTGAVATRACLRLRDRTTESMELQRPSTKTLSTAGRGRIQSMTTEENTSARERARQARERAPEAKGSYAPVKITYEFTGQRAELFKDALREYPHARRDCHLLMRRYLEPRAGDYILGFGEGSGHFCRPIAEAV